MLLMQHHQDGIVRRLHVIGVPKYTIKPFVAEMCKWERCSGVEWTIKRLKGLKVDLIRRREGLPPLTWVRKNRKGDVAGVVGSLFRWSEKSDRNFNRAIQAFMAYTFYIHGSLTETQKEKFLSSLSPEEGAQHDPDFLAEFGLFVRNNTKRRRVSSNPKPLFTYRGSSEKKAPRLFGPSSVPQSELIMEDLFLFNTDPGRLLYCKYREIFHPLLKGCDSRRDYLESILAGCERTLGTDPFPFQKLEGGSISLLQEPGGKLRSVASPLRIYQEALRPLSDVLYGMVGSLPWDCTFDQTKAIPHIKSHLGKGGRVHSVDLSSATDLFPLDVQVTALKSILDVDSHLHVDLFAEISRAEWESPLGRVRWKKGQPLGLLPSFAAFTLTHGLLLLYLAEGDFHNQFFVVGDDVVIFEDKLRDKYIAMLDKMRCPWSPDKSISSSELAEFAGKIITRRGVVPQMKWRRMSDDNFLDVCRLLGQRSRCLLSKRQKRVFDTVSSLTEPVGLNFSLPGDNLEKMINRTLDFYQPDKAVLASQMGLRKRLNRLVHTSTEPLNADELEKAAATFDEKVRSVMEQTVFRRFETCLELGIDGFATLPEALGIRPRLPLRESKPSRVSTLERYEGLLH